MGIEAGGAVRSWLTLPCHPVAMKVVVRLTLSIVFTMQLLEGGYCRLSARISCCGNITVIAGPP